MRYSVKLAHFSTTIVSTSEFADSGENAGHPNNFNILRFIAAASVILCHSYALRYPAGALDDRYILNSAGIGWAAVNIFFVMSGYLIARSIKRDPGIVRFGANRMLRIYPGLFVCIIITTVALGIIYRGRDFESYIINRQTVMFYLSNISALNVKFYLPGVFENNIYVGAVNGSLWSLPFEISCYVIIGLAYFSGMLRTVTRQIVVFSFFLLFYLIGGLLMEMDKFPHSVSLLMMHRLAICFSLGALYAYINPRLEIKLWYPGVAFMLFLLSCLSPLLFLRDAMATIFLSLFVFWAAFVQRPLLKWLRDLPDWSYGLYIYAWPIQQLIVAVRPGLSPIEHFCTALLLTAIPAALSWHFIEKPALVLKDSRFLSKFFAPKLQVQ